MGKARKPLPQFSSRDECEEFYSKYGTLTYWGNLGPGEWLYQLDVVDGRKIRMKIYDDGRVEELVF